MRRDKPADKEQMEELHVEVVTYNDFESCGWHREVSFEALTGRSRRRAGTSAHLGRPDTPKSSRA